MKKVGKVILAIFGVIVILFAGVLIFFNNGMGQIKTVSVDKVIPSSVVDGVHLGKFSTGRWANEVQVTVKDHKITDIRIVKDQLAKSPQVADGVISSIMKKQSLDVDIIAGATITTKAYLKAVENALKNGTVK